MLLEKLYNKTRERQKHELGYAFIKSKIIRQNRPFKDKEVMGKFYIY